MSTDTTTARRARIRAAQPALDRIIGHAKREKRRPPRAVFTGLCCLCGTPCSGTYCYAHTWAAGT